MSCRQISSFGAVAIASAQGPLELLDLAVRVIHLAARRHAQCFADERDDALLLLLARSRGGAHQGRRSLQPLRRLHRAVQGRGRGPQPNQGQQRVDRFTALAGLSQTLEQRLSAFGGAAQDDLEVLGLRLTVGEHRLGQVAPGGMQAAHGRQPERIGQAAISPFEIGRQRQCAAGHRGHQEAPRTGKPGPVIRGSVEWLADVAQQGQLLAQQIVECSQLLPRWSSSQAVQEGARHRAEQVLRQFQALHDPLDRKRGGRVVRARGVAHGARRLHQAAENRPKHPEPPVIEWIGRP
jgi:hypothetical protein